MLKDDDCKTLLEKKFTVIPRRFKIPLDATSIHGITTNKAMNVGTRLKDVMSIFAMDLSNADIVVAHNLNFDIKVVGAELIRTNIKNDLSKKGLVCTLQSSIDYCKLPGKYGGYKWPSLSELYYKLFVESFGDQHDAMADVQACARCFFELRRLGVLTI